MTKENYNQLKQLLVVGEQGIGDIIQFSRYIKTLRAKGMMIRFCLEKKLHSLVKASAIDPMPIDKVDATQISNGHWVPLLSIPRILEVTPEKPIITEPYIKASDDLIRYWKIAFSELRKPIIGINWKSNRRNTIKNSRDIPVEYFAQLSQSFSGTFISLQKDSQYSELKKIYFKNNTLALQEKINRIVDSDNPEDFHEYAAIVANCGLVITADTTVAHLSASMGTKTWVLLQGPKLRWGIHGAHHSGTPPCNYFVKKLQ